MSNQLAQNGATALDRWKALAKIENRIARKNWGAPSGSFANPATPANPEEQAAREQRAPTGVSYRDGTGTSKKVRANFHDLNLPGFQRMETLIGPICRITKGIMFT